jgi:alcohol dehydrogenase, propanol-preferring
MRSARIVKPKQHLEIKQLETPKPEDSQVIMKVKSSAVCQSDVHLWEAG